MDAAGFGKAPPVNASVERLPGQPAETQVRAWKTSWRAEIFTWPAHSGTCSCVLCLCVFKYGSSRSEMEQLLCTCSGFIYLGMEPFVTTIPPDKIAALNMSGIVWTYMFLACTISGNLLCLCDMIICIKQSSCAVVSRLRSCCPSNMRFCYVVTLVPCAFVYFSGGHVLWLHHLLPILQFSFHFLSTSVPHLIWVIGGYRSPAYLAACAWNFPGRASSLICN